MQELEQLYDTLGRRLYNYILNLSGSSHIAEEVAQETFYRATEHMIASSKALQPAWFYKVARHIFLDDVRRSKKHVSSEDFDKVDESPHHSPEVTLERSEKRRTVQEVLAELPENYRTILILREFQEFSYQEIAEIMGMNMDSVKVGLFRARQRFKQLYDRRD